MVDAKRKAFIFLLLAFILAVVVSGLVIRKVQDIAEASGEIETVEVATAAGDISSYTPLTSDDVEWKEIQAPEERGNYIYRDSDIDDQFPIVDLTEGNYITDTILRETIPVPEDHRVVILNVTDNVIMDQRVAEGDKVDIVVVYQKEENMTSQRLFQKVNVVQVHHDSGEQENADTVKVSLSIDDSQQLIYYQNVAEQIRVLRLNGSNDGEALKNNGSADSGESNKTSEENASNGTGEDTESDDGENNDDEDSDTNENNDQNGNNPDNGN